MGGGAGAGHLPRAEELCSVLTLTVAFRKSLIARPFSYVRGEIMAYKFEVYTDKAGETRFRFKAPNGESMCASEGYKSKKSALDAIASIQKNCPGAAIEDKTTR